MLLLVGCVIACIMLAPGVTQLLAKVCILYAWHAYVYMYSIFTYYVIVFANDILVCHLLYIHVRSETQQDSNHFGAWYNKVSEMPYSHWY